MDAKGDERLIAEDLEGVDTVCRHDDRNAGFQRNGPFLGVEPGFLRSGPRSREWPSEMTAARTEVAMADQSRWPRQVNLAPFIVTLTFSTISTR